MKNNRINTILFLIIIAGFTLRLIPAFSRSVWDDEASTIQISQTAVKNIINNSWATHPPGYYILMHYFLKISNNQVYLRFPSVVFGTLIIITIYLLGKELISQEFALILSSVVSMSPFFINFSWQMLMYALSQLLVSLSLLFFLYFLKTTNKKSAVFFLIPLCLGIWVNYGFLWFILAYLILVFVIYLDANNQKLKIYAITIGIGTLLNLTLIIKYLLPRLNSAFSLIGWLPPLELDYLSNQVLNLLGFGDFTYRLSGRHLFEIPLILVVIVSIIHLIFLKGGNGDRRKYVFLFIKLLLITSLFSPVMISFYKNIFLFRNIYPAAFPLHFGLALFIYELREKRYLFFIIVTYLIFLLIYSSVFIFISPRGESFWEKTNWFNIANYIKVHQKKNDRIIFMEHHHYLVTPFLYYYDRGKIGQNSFNNIDFVDCQNLSLNKKRGGAFWIIIGKAPRDSYRCLTKILNELKCSNFPTEINENLYHCLPLF